MASFKVKACGQGFHSFNDSAPNADNRYCVIIKDVTGTTKLVSLDNDEFIMEAFTVDTNVVVGTGKKLVCVPQASAITDLASSPTIPQISTAINSILAVLRSNKLIVT